MDHGRLGMSVGGAMLTQRSIRRFRPDPIPIADLQLILEAAVRAPNGGNRQIGRFLVVTDRERLARFGALSASRSATPAEGASFGGSRRLPTRETTSFDHWGAPVPWT
jgi:nitroreductase